MFCSIPWFVAFDPLPMGAPGAAENGGVWLGAEAPGPEWQMHIFNYHDPSGCVPIFTSKAACGGTNWAEASTGECRRRTAASSAAGPVLARGGMLEQDHR